MIINQQLAKIFYQIAEFLEMEEVEFKPRAYEKVARVLESMSIDVSEIYKKEGLAGLEKISGVGIGIAKKIEEYIKTGKIKDYEKLKKECPVQLEELGSIEGVGPKIIKILYKELGIRNMRDLERAANAGKIRGLPRFGPKTEENILKGIEFVKRGAGRLLLRTALPAARLIEKRLKEQKIVKQAEVAGSIRRRKETIGDLDILAVSTKPQEVIDFFVNMPEVEKIYAKGATKSSVRLNIGLDADLRVVENKSFGAALQYFTGSKDHNINLRKIAIEKGLKLNEYGVFKKIGKREEYLAGRTEKEVYQILGLVYIEPELRENTGEIEAAFKKNQHRRGSLPILIGYNDIKGDLQMHTTWSDGSHSIEEMAGEAIRMGYEYIAITDHVGKLKIAGSLDRNRLLEQIKEIDKINAQFERNSIKFRILKGAEVDIGANGDLDISGKILAKLDIVLASIHSGFKMSKSAITKRICRSMENPYVDIISHPTGRVIQRREGYEVDLDTIFEFAKRTQTALEINAHPDRLDLNDIDIRRAVKSGVKLVINTDAHTKDHFSFMELGIAQARRGWAEKKDILNTFLLEDLLKQLKQKN